MAAAPPSAPASGRHAEVTVEPAHTLAYVAEISLAMSPFVRHGNVYASDYAVKVFPFFLFNEHGRILIEISEEQLQKLDRGETVDFKGHAVNSSGKERRVEGRAVADAAGSDRGRIKVRVWLTRRIELVFNTVYQLTGGE